MIASPNDDTRVRGECVFDFGYDPLGDCRRQEAGLLVTLDCW